MPIPYTKRTTALFATFIAAMALTPSCIKAEERAPNEMVLNAKRVNIEEQTLYIYEGCPACDDVLHALETLDLQLSIVDLKENPERAVEINALGCVDVPCLMVQGEAVNQAESIIELLYTFEK